MAPRDPTQIFFRAAQAMVDAIWADLGLRYPPAVGRMSRNSTGTLARGDRLSVLLPDHTPSWCLLHELAHAMTTLEDGRSDGHGPIFMGIYVRLLVRYLRFDEADLILSLQKAGIRVAPKAKPIFADP